MTTERSPWWKSFLPKKKSGASKDSNQPFGPDFDPFAQKQKDYAAEASKSASDQSQQASNKSFSDDTYDDSHLESVFNEQTCRRTMKVSRSGRWKEKRRVRSSLPIEDKEKDSGATGKEERRWPWRGRGGDHRLLCNDAWRKGEELRRAERWRWRWEGAFNFEPSAAGVSSSCGTWNNGNLDFFVKGHNDKWLEITYYLFPMMVSEPFCQQNPIIIPKQKTNSTNTVND